MFFKTCFGGRINLEVGIGSGDRLRLLAKQTSHPDPIHIVLGFGRRQHDSDVEPKLRMEVADADDIFPERETKP